MTLSLNVATLTQRVQITLRSRFKAFVLTVALGIGFCFAHGSVWAACVGNTTVLVSQGQINNNNSWLCSLTINAGGTLDLNGHNFGSSTQTSGTIPAITMSGTI